MKILGEKIGSNIFSKSGTSHTSILPQWAFLQEKTIKVCSKFRGGQEVEINKLPTTKFVVHTIRDFEIQSPLLVHNAENLLSTWDVISTSLIKSGSYTKTQWADVGLILAVPPQNIISCFQRDVSFQNHVGNKPGMPKNTYALAECYFRGQAKGGHLVEGGTYAVIHTPDDILRNSVSGKHNEILVVGRPNIRIYEGYSATQRVQVCGIYYHQCVNGEEKDILTRDKNHKIINKLLKENENLPVFKEITWSGKISMGYESKVMNYLRRF